MTTLVIERVEDMENKQGTNSLNIFERKRNQLLITYINQLVELVLDVDESEDYSNEKVYIL